MKKFFAIAVVAMIAISANAQTWLGGSFGFDWEKSKNDHAKAKTSWEIAPEIGYNLDETWAVAIKLGVASVKHGDNDAVTGFQVNPYARYTFCEMDKLSFFVDGGVNYTTYGKNAGNSFGIGVQPGLCYKASDTVSLVAKFGYFGWKTYSEENANKDQFGLGVDGNALSFGVYFAL